MPRLFATSLCVLLLLVVPNLGAFNAEPEVLSLRYGE